MRDSEEYGGKLKPLHPRLFIRVPYLNTEGFNPNQLVDMVTIGILMAVSFIVATLLALFLLGKGSNKSVVANASVKAVNTQRVYTKSEVAQHNKRTDCWIIINDKVYDVSPYVEEHPGGDAILKHAGDDSTEGFNGPQHASRVFDMVDEFYVGDLKQ